MVVTVAGSSLEQQLFAASTEDPAGLDEMRALLSQGAAVDGFKDKHGNTALNVACMNGHRGTIKFLLENGASPDVPDEDGEGALHIAAGMGWAKTVVTLLKHGARLDALNNKGQDSLAIARENSFSKVIKVLEEATESGVEHVLDRYKAEIEL